MELDTNPTKPTKYVRLIEKSDLSIVRLTESWLYMYIYIYLWPKSILFIEYWSNGVEQITTKNKKDYEIE